jgi:hypothetical protein
MWCYRASVVSVLFIVCVNNILRNRMHSQKLFISFNQYVIFMFTYSTLNVTASNSATEFETAICLWAGIDCCGETDTGAEVLMGSYI